MTSPAVTAGTVQPLSDNARRMYRGAIWLVIIAEAMIFVTLFSTRFLLAGMDRPVEPTDPLGLTVTATLVVSLIPTWMGLRNIAGGDSSVMSRNLAISALLSAAALVVIVYDWTTLSFPPGSPFGENYIVSTGYHAAHIAIGGIWLAAAAVAGRRGAYTKDNHWVVEGGVRFWMFVVAMWIALYVVFFVL
ncbi:cytochrome c oxidase subunit 3 [Hyphomonas sp.]|uniref:cytochrome c oxidase subunit 3 n=1 Tax=Alphaproteobacteria TaxID=28211 RepID=UPI003267A51E